MRIQCLAQEHNTMSPARGLFLEVPEKSSHPESHSKISNLMFTELLYSHILNINRGSLDTRSFRRVQLSVSRYTDELKIALRARNVFGAFEKRVPELEPGPLDPETSALTIRPPRP